MLCGRSKSRLLHLNETAIEKVKFIDELLNLSTSPLCQVRKVLPVTREKKSV